MEECKEKHTKYQPTIDEWKCPKCGSIGLYVEDDIDPDFCDKLHSDSWVYCDKCDYCNSTKKFTEYIMKQKNLVVCPTCKGKGYVNKQN